MSGRKGFPGRGEDQGQDPEPGRGAERRPEGEAGCEVMGEPREQGPQGPC